VRELSTAYSAKFRELRVHSAAERAGYGEQGLSTPIAEFVESRVGGATFTAVGNIRLM